MKKLIAVAAVLWAVPSFAQPPAAQPGSAIDLSGSIAAGVQQLDNSTNSSKLTEYRDIRERLYLPEVTFSAAHVRTGWFFDLSGTNLTRDDQTILVDAGQPGRWSFQVDWIEVPHHFSNKAVTPYAQRSPGLFEVPETVPITFKKLGTTAADTAGVLASDNLIAAYQAALLAPTPLGTQTNTGHFAAAWSGSDALTLAVAYDRRNKSGLKAAFGPIGDRPPRTLNIQLPEPVDYRTNDLTFSAEHDGGAYQVRGEYLLSDFVNRIDTLQWQNVYATGAPGATFDVWDRSLAVYGVRPLPPDNRYHNVSAAFGGDLPFDSRVTATAAYGRFEQNETLLPYSYNDDQLAVRTLPRSTADASLNTVNVTADYVIAPIRRLNVRTFYRWYDLSNETPSSQWQYVTSDTSNLNGTVSYVNKRVNVPYEWDRQNAGVEATWRLPARTSFTVAYEREAIGREHREADTTESIIRGSSRTRASRWITVQARYLQGMRDGGTYDGAVTKEGYWYTQAEARDNNNPALTFDNHPDMRRFDVSDRQRRQIDLTLTLTPRDVLAVSAFIRSRHDDFDSPVAPSQPLLGTGLADERATTPGDQLGLLEDARLRYGLDVFVQPIPRIGLNAFVNYDKGTSSQRSLEFNENNKANPSAVATAELGPWTRAGSQWTADFDDRTWSGGLGATLQMVPDRLTFMTDYTLSAANVDIVYSGFGVTNFNGTPFPANHQFAFAAPPTIRENLHVLNLRFEIPLRPLVLVAGYSYEKYELEDWQQETNAPWIEAVGADTLLRDSSRSFQWGNRLFILGSTLAPGYNAHIGYVSLRYRF